MSGTALGTDWESLLTRWDVQQGVYIEGRERAYDVMLGTLDQLVEGDDVVVVDLASGPGSISTRLLDRRPGARCVAVDADPVLHAVGRGALGDRDGRLRWVQADLRDPAWAERLGEKDVDAVLSSTALHWLDPAALATLYRSLAELVRPGGVFVNFDGFATPGSTSGIGGAIEAMDRARQQRAVDAGAEAWQDWWDAVRAIPELADAFAQRDRIFAPATGRIFGDSGRRRGTSLALHEAVLAEAGFAETGVVWQDLHKKILVAVR